MCAIQGLQDKVRPAALLVLSVLLLLLVLLPALWQCAQAAEPAAHVELMTAEGPVKTVIGFFTSEVDRIKQPFMELARLVFYVMCSVSIVMQGINLMFRDGDLQTFFLVVVKFLLVAGFFWFFIEQGPDWSSQLVNSLMSIEERTSGTGGVVHSGPAELASATIEISGQLLSQVEDLQGVLSVDYLMILLFILIFDCLIFGVIGSCMLAHIALYVMCVMGCVMLGFGTFALTRGLAVNYLKSLVALGFELFTLQLICNVAMSVMVTIRVYYRETGGLTLDDCCVMLLVAIVFSAVSHSLPALVGSLVYNFSVAERSSNMAGNFLARLSPPFLPVRVLSRLTGKVFSQSHNKRGR